MTQIRKRIYLFLLTDTGLMFQETENGLLVNPHKKLMPAFFLYGQTIKPIELEIKGKYELIVFQLYPFVLKSFFKVEPQTINDDCYDLELLQEADISTFIKKIKTLETSIEKRKYHFTTSSTRRKSKPSILKLSKSLNLF
jgi:hypothetical protein